MSMVSASSALVFPARSTRANLSATPPVAARPDAVEGDLRPSSAGPERCCGASRRPAARLCRLSDLGARSDLGALTGGSASESSRSVCSGHGVGETRNACPA
jgi:hypothetical protein